MVKGVKFGDYHSFEEWQLMLHERPAVSSPAPQYNFIKVPGTAKRLDLSKTLTGEMIYDTRKITCTFETFKTRKKWSDLYSDILDKIHGKEMKIVLDEDKGYYYFGYVTVNDWQSDEKYSTIVVEAEVEPYKYEMQSSLEPWLWDPFNFNNGIIRYYKDIEVVRQKDLVIKGTRMPVVPIFDVRGTVKVRYKGSVYQLTEGLNRVPDIRIGEGENVLRFMGTGTISVDYRGGRL